MGKVLLTSHPGQDEGIFPLECLGFRVQGLGFRGRGFRGLGTKAGCSTLNPEPFLNAAKDSSAA